MTINVRSTQPTARPTGKPAGQVPSADPKAPKAPVAAAAVAAAGVSAGADATIAKGLGTGNLHPVDGLIDQAAANAATAATAAPAVKALSSAARVAGAVKKGAVQRFFEGALRMITPSPAQVARIKGALEYVRQNVWERGLDKLAKMVGMDDLSKDIKILADPPDVNAPNAQAEAQAKRDMANPALKGQTTQAIAKLPPADRQAYEKMSLQLKDQPRAQAALQLLVRQGKLASPDLAGGQSLMTHLAAIGSQTLDPRVKKAGQTELVSHVLLELAEPGARSKRA